MTATQKHPDSSFTRGQALRLSAHEDHCDDVAELVALCSRSRDSTSGRLLAADLFSGAGGMSLGLEAAGMQVVFGADHDHDALETHAHHFGGMSVGWDLGDADTVSTVGEILRAVRIDVIAGGPPCQPFSKAGRSGMRHLVREGRRDSHDRRRDLWRSFLEVIDIARPRAVIMENVPDMALDREMFILRSVVLTLEQLGYSVQERVIDTHHYGVPQFRQRLILVAIQEGLEFTWPAPASRRPTLKDALTDLPEVDPRDGWRPTREYNGWRVYDGPARTQFQREMRAQVPEDDSRRIYDHVTRRVRPDDAEAFEHLDTKTRYSELPERLKRYRDDIFDDKYKRLDADDLSRTITAHIAKDGYWYIHPEQNRTITIREAARIQTFPDHFRFAGAPTSAFRQIGNAVPPMLGRAVGRAVINTLVHGAPGIAVPTASTGKALAQWFRSHPEPERPWVRSGSRWLTLVGETFLGGCTTDTVRALWPHVERLNNPRTLVHDRNVLLELAGWIDRPTEAQRLIAAAELVIAQDGNALHDDELDLLVSLGHISRPTADLAMVVDSEGEEPVVATAGALRVAGRYFQGSERWLSNRNSEGRMAVARLIGYEEFSRDALLGLMSLGTSVCTPKGPACHECPLSGACKDRR